MVGLYVVINFAVHIFDFYVFYCIYTIFLPISISFDGANIGALPDGVLFNLYIVVHIYFIDF